MKNVLIACLLAAGSLCTVGAGAQTSMPTDPSAPAKDDALFQALGGKSGLQTLMDAFVAGLKADPRIGERFKDTQSSYLADQLVSQVCAATGGPCIYRGADMKSVHAGMEINKANFNALVEVLQATMDAQHIPFRTQNQLLAILAPMHRDVINAE